MNAYLTQQQRDCGVVGAGNSAHALASYLRHQGHRVHLYARRPEQIEHLVRRPLIQASGKLEGQYELEWVGHDPAEMVRRCQTLFVCTTATAYGDVVQQIGPHLDPEHEVILFSSKLGGSLEVEQTLRGIGKRAVKVVETDALFACRLQPDHSIWIRGFKEWNLFSSPRRSQTNRNQEAIQRYFPHLEKAENLIQRGLTDFGALAHALTVLVNMNLVDRQEEFLFYYDGYTERTVVLLEQLEQEFQAIAKAYNTSLLPASELLNRYYGCQTTSLLEAMRTVPNYRHSVAPQGLETRYLSEDVGCTLVPAQQLAQLAELHTPVLDSVIAMASVIHGVDYRLSGRTLDKLGWGDFGVREIRQWMAW